MGVSSMERMKDTTAAGSPFPDQQQCHHGRPSGLMLMQEPRVSALPNAGMMYYQGNF